MGTKDRYLIRPYAVVDSSGMVLGVEAGEDMARAMAASLGDGASHRPATARETAANALITYAGVDPAKIAGEKALIDELHLDSLDSVELIMRVEDEYIICIEDREAEQVLTVDDLVSLLSRKLGIESG